MSYNPLGSASSTAWDSLRTLRAAAKDTSMDSVKQRDYEDLKRALKEACAVATKLVGTKIKGMSWFGRNHK